MNELKARVEAAQKTLDEFRVRKFEIGKSDCAQMVKFHARAMGCPLKGIAKAGSYKTPLGMRRALRRLDAGTVGDLIDRQKGFLPIAPAARLPGDIVELADLGDDENEGAGGGALVVALTNGRVVGYHEDAETAVVLQPGDSGSLVRAWRVPVIV